MQKHTGGKALLATVVLATGFSSAVAAPAASAQEASFQVTDEGVSGIEADDILTILTAVTRLAETVNQSQATDTTDPAAVSGGSSEADVILDPLMLLLESSSIQSADVESLEELESLTDLEDLISVTTMRPERGQTADGRTVVFPTSGRFTSGYGARWGATHEGIDIANPIGTPVLAVMDGEVISAGNASGFGKWVRVRHDDGAISVYGHVATIDVTVGERVTAGQRIAGMGNEGRSTGPHLHFEIRPDGNRPVDPVDWFAEQGIDVR
ncbi:M23 family metallopeptidase [Corynebacterium suedekumii]|nr:M23 family metallopeptidase [Corynebacterium suedekumii]